VLGQLPVVPAPGKDFSFDSIADEAVIGFGRRGGGEPDAVLGANGRTMAKSLVRRDGSRRRASPLMPRAPGLSARLFFTFAGRF
jgi:hypothetical protein